MAVYNGQRYLREAVESILNQTFRGFEFIIVDDGSTDTTAAILAGFHDPRLVLLKNETNIGLTKSLNRGLRAARGDFIARMDADDISLPERIEKQVAYFDAHPETGILGSTCVFIDAYNKTGGRKPRPLNDLEIRWASLLKNPFMHPTVMLRRDIMIKNNLAYDEALQAAQDYDLFTRMLNHTRGANLGEPLVKYREHSEDLTTTHREIQLKNHDLIAVRTIREQVPDIAITREQVSMLRALFTGAIEFAPPVSDERLGLAHLYLDLLEAYLQRNARSPHEKTLQRREAVRVAKIIFRMPPERGLVGLIRRLLTIDRLLLWDIACLVTGVMFWKVKQATILGGLHGKEQDSDI